MKTQHITIPEKIGRQMIKGRTYVFVPQPYWNKEKQQTRNRRRYIGYEDAGGNFHPNKEYLHSLEATDVMQSNKISTIKQPQQQAIAERSYYGATYLFNSIATKLGIVQGLKEAFPGNYLQILSLAYYLILENDSTMFRFEKFQKTHYLPYRKVLPSQRISELLGTISENAKLDFFVTQSNRRIDKECLAYDTTSISSYSEIMEHVKNGKNTDGDDLPQINLALVFGEQSMLPVYYRKLPGNITDVKTAEKLLADLSPINIKKIKLVMDRGFYSSGNIDTLLEKKFKFLIGIKNNVQFVESAINNFSEAPKNHTNYSSEHDVYYCSSMINWNDARKEKSTGKLKNPTKTIYLHIYYNPQKAETEKSHFIKTLEEAREAMYKNTATDKQLKIIHKYFTAIGSGNKKITLEYNDKKIQKYLGDCGYFCLLTDNFKEPKLSLQIYRNKDLAEKAFYNLKNRLNLRITAVGSSENFEGKLFIQFVSLIIMSYIHKQMKSSNLYSKYTMETCLDEMDIIERFDYPNNKTYYAEQTKNQIELFKSFEVEPLT